MRRFLTPSLVAGALSLAAAISYVGYRTFSGGPHQAAEPTRSAGSPLPDALPQFVLDDLAGRPTPLSTWAGQPLIVNFWATWCAPCLREIPLLKEFQDAHTDLQIIGIAIDRVEPVAAFAAEMRFNYPVLVGPEAMNAAGAFGVDFVALPFTVFTSRDGSVLGVHTGELRPEHLAALADTLADLDAGRIDLDRARARLAGRI